MVLFSICHYSDKNLTRTRSFTQEYVPQKTISAALIIRTQMTSLRPFTNRRCYCSKILVLNETSGLIYNSVGINTVAPQNKSSPLLVEAKWKLYFVPVEPWSWTCYNIFYCHIQR